MGSVLFILLVGLPLFELWLLIEVGSAIGGVEVIALSLFTAAVGLALVRRQGLGVLQKLQTNQGNNAAAGRALIHGVFLLLAGLCLLIPGFFTDIVGALLLIPPVRIALGALGLAHWAARMSPLGAHAEGTHRRYEHREHSREDHGDRIVDTEVIVSWEETGPDAGPNGPGKPLP